MFHPPVSVYYCTTVDALLDVQPAGLKALVVLCCFHLQLAFDMFIKTPFSISYKIIAKHLYRWCSDQRNVRRWGVEKVALRKKAKTQVMLDILEEAAGVLPRAHIIMSKFLGHYPRFKRDK